MASAQSPSETQSYQQSMARIRAGDLAEPRRRPRIHPAQLHPVRRGRRVPAGRDRAHAGPVAEAAAAARAGAREGRARRLAGAFRHPRARARLHRQGARDHRRPADRCAAQARDHAVRRLARGRGEPQVVRLRAGPAGRRDLHQVPQDAQRRRLRRLHARHQEGRGRRTSSPACRTPTAAAASSATTAAWRSTAWTFSSPTRSARRHELDDRHSTEDVIRLREELAEQIRSLKELKEMASHYGFDISGPAAQRPRSDAVDLLRLSRGHQAAERRGDVGGPPVHVLGHLLRARSARRHADRVARHRKSSTTS